MDCSKAGYGQHPPARRLSADYFEAKYVNAPDRDPWRFLTDDYEQTRYHALLAALPRERYQSVFEPGCSIGALTVRLAERCDSILAVDFAPTAVAAAVQRYGSLANVEFRCATFSEGLNESGRQFDLIVLAEIGYYFSESQLDALTTKLAERLLPGGDLIAQHWTGDSFDHSLTGAQTHTVIAASLHWPLLRRQHHPRFMLDVWRRPRS